MACQAISCLVKYPPFHSSTLPSFHPLILPPFHPSTHPSFLPSTHPVLLQAPGQPGLAAAAGEASG